MNKIKSLFSTPKRAIASSAFIVAILLSLFAGTAYASEVIAESSAIGIENAKNFAFADAGIDPISAVVEHTEFDFEMGQFVYEVEFTVNGTEYEYLIKASNGTVLKKSTEIVTLDGKSVIATAKITADQAKEKALEDAGVSVSDVVFIKAKLDHDDGFSVYDIEFRTKTHEYEYEINAVSGAVHERDIEPLKTEAVKPKHETEASVQEPPVNNKYIGVEKAKDIALERSKLSASEITFKKAKLDFDAGMMIYEIEFYYGGMEYECEVNAITGEILEYSCERDD